MLEVEVKNYSWNNLYGRYEYKEFANSINNETVILFSLESEYCIVLYQKNFNEIKVGKFHFPEIKNFISRDVISDELKLGNFPTNYTLIKAEKNRDYIFVSEKYRDAYDVSLVENYKGQFNWEVVSKEYSKGKYPIINLSGKVQE